ncbi:hypothetical protein ANCCAN_03119 [Ancylostoma caninum]|uniref:Dipeptidylpeptidase IV N-terminal domain-containing protein n=1 Tax=Ancylostoma caninum TaxID=29170 RepID=A0A368H2A8_ANCCA|nr:hypothetical protein ANCCAN_03119 [Ancylostoma caninum]
MKSRKMRAVMQRFIRASLWSTFRLTYKVGITKTNDEAQRIFKWNPVDNDYVFWQDDHLYYSDSAESSASIQISDGGPNCEHGIFEWVYEEEIFGRGSKVSLNRHFS